MKILWSITWSDLWFYAIIIVWVLYKLHKSHTWVKNIIFYFCEGESRPYE